MALRKIKNVYHAYFKKLVPRPDGSLDYQISSISLHTGDLILAKAMEAELMRKNREKNQHARFVARMNQLDPDHATPLPLPEAKPNRLHRLRLSLGLETMAKYREPTPEHIKFFKKFISVLKYTYFDEITPEIALSTLNALYSNKSGKTFNNAKSALNTVFRILSVDAGIPSPFKDIPDRRHTAKHQRPFTEEEFVRIYNAAPEPWKLASLIAWHTGMREETVFNLKWSNLKDNVITAMPGKTARFGRAVQVPLHPQIMERLKKLPRKNDDIFGCFKFSRNSSHFVTQFGKILEELQIGETPQGIVNFNSFRDSFITRCDEQNLPRHAIRGLVGHISDRMTDLYSHDLTTAQRILTFPAAKLSKPNKKTKK